MKLAARYSGRAPITATIVYRAVHRQAADVAAGEEQRAHHVGVGRHHQALARRRGSTAPSSPRASQSLAKARSEQFGR
jgi:hypothetical protein